MVRASRNMRQKLSNKMEQYTVYLYLQTAVHVSGGISNPSSGAHITVSTVSGCIETVTATSRECHAHDR